MSVRGTCVKSVYFTPLAVAARCIGRCEIHSIFLVSSWETSFVMGASSRFLKTTTASKYISNIIYDMKHESFLYPGKLSYSFLSIDQLSTFDPLHFWYCEISLKVYLMSGFCLCYLLCYIFILSITYFPISCLGLFLFVCYTSFVKQFHLSIYPFL